MANKISATECDTEAFVVTHLSMMNFIALCVEKLSNYCI